MKKIILYVVIFLIFTIKLSWASDMIDVSVSSTKVEMGESIICK